MFAVAQGFRHRTCRRLTAFWRRQAEVRAHALQGLRLALHQLPRDCLVRADELGLPIRRVNIFTRADLRWGGGSLSSSTGGPRPLCVVVRAVSGLGHAIRVVVAQINHPALLRGTLQLISCDLEACSLSRDCNLIACCGKLRSLTFRQKQAEAINEIWIGGEHGGDLGRDGSHGHAGFFVILEETHESGVRMIRQPCLDIRDELQCGIKTWFVGLRCGRGSDSSP